MRMGGDKLNRRLGRNRLIDVAVARAQSWDVPLAIAVRETGQVSDVDVEQIPDASVDGPLGGLLAALEWAAIRGLDRVVIMPCDMPFLPSDLLARLKNSCATLEAPAFARSAGRDHPVCSIWLSSTAPRVWDFARTGGRSLKGALQVCGGVAVEWAVGPTDPFVNLNTPDDLEQVRRRDGDNDPRPPQTSCS